MAKAKAAAKPTFNLFAKATTQVAKPETTKKPKGTTWVVPSDRLDLREAVVEIASLNTEIKTLETRQKLAVSRIAEFAFDKFTDAMADHGAMPSTPMKVVDEASGESVSYIVQDRSASYEVKSEEMVSAVGDIVGEALLSEVFTERVSFSFNDELLSIPAVQEKVNEALSGALTELIGSGVLTADQAGQLLSAKAFKGFRPGIVARIPELVKRNKSKVRELIEAIGSCCVRYIRAV